MLGSLGGVLIGADRNPEIIDYVFLYNDLALFRWGSNFDAYPHRLGR